MRDTPHVGSVDRAAERRAPGVVGARGQIVDEFVVAHTAAALGRTPAA